MRVIITGASSFLGKASADLLREKGHEVVCLRHSYEENEDLLPGKADVWIHFAWAGKGSSGRSDTDIQKYNVSMSVSAFVKAGELGCSRFMFAGSQAEYGGVHACTSETASSGLRTLLQREDSPCIPVSAYGKAKLEVLDKIIKTINDRNDTNNTNNVNHTSNNAYNEYNAHNANNANSTNHTGSVNIKKSGSHGQYPLYVHMRFFSVYGPGDHGTSLVSSLIDACLEKRHIALGNCSQLWNYLYIDDAARAVALLTAADLSRFEQNPGFVVVNVASDEILPLRDYVAVICSKAGYPEAPFFGKRPDNAEGSADLVPDTGFIRELGFVPVTDFPGGIRKMLNIRKQDSIDSGKNPDAEQSLLPESTGKLTGV